MREVKAIRNAQRHSEALERLEYLMSQNPDKESDEFFEMEVLSMLIEQYEIKTYPTPKLDPIEAIEIRMEELNLSRQDMEKYLGHASKVSEILNRKRPLSIEMIRKLNAKLGIPAEVLIQKINTANDADSKVSFTRKEEATPPEKCQNLE